MEKLNQRLKEIEDLANRQKKEAYIEYINRVKKADVGDIITDDTDIIQVDKINYSLRYGGVTMFYTGVKLSKKLVPYKNGDVGSIFDNCNNFKIIKKSGN